MDQEAKQSVAKVAVRIGGGPPPGYHWNVDVLNVAHKEAEGFLNPDQYEHLARQVREVAREHDPTHCKTVDVDKVEDFWEIREKGGILGKLNVRVFFSVDTKRQTIVVLSVINKTSEHQTPPGVKTTVRRRLRLYLEVLERGP